MVRYIAAALTLGGGFFVNGNWVCRCRPLKNRSATSLGWHNLTNGIQNITLRAEPLVALRKRHLKRL